MATMCAWFIPCDADGENGPRVRLVPFLLAFLLIYTAWAWAGLRPGFHRVGVATAGLLLAAVAWEGRGAAVRAAFRDPVFQLGLAFLAYLAVQWLNAGRTQYYDVGYRRWTYTNPPWPNWPSAFARADAAQMLAWFFPAWAIAVAIRSGLASARVLRRLLMLVAINAGLLATFGLIQLASGTDAIFWVRPLKTHFFASFAYGNHAAPYFVLVGAWACGLLFREIFDVRNPHRAALGRLRHPGRVALLVPAAVLCLAGANMGFSRAGVILAGVLAVFVVVYGWLRAWRLLSPAGRVNGAAVSLAVVGSLYFLVAGFGEGGIRKEFTLRAAEPGVLRTLWDRIDLELGGRPQYARAAAAIWSAHPWFGVGGWGYKYLVADHVPATSWPALEKRGWANVHVDFLQFLAEFGAVGMALLLGALAVLARGACDFRRCRRDACWTLSVAGLALTVLFSGIDIPFRCPAILYAWTAMLAALPALCLAPERRLFNAPPALPAAEAASSGRIES